MKFTTQALARMVAETSLTTKPEDMDALCQSALKILVDHGKRSDLRRFPHLVERAYDALVPHVVLKTPSAFTTDSSRLSAALHTSTGSSAQIQEEHDDSLMAGATLQAGDERFDVSLAGMLERASIQLRSASFSS